MNRAYMFTPKEYMEKYGDYDKMEQVLTNTDSTLDEIAAVLEEYLYAVRDGEGNTKYMPSLTAQIFSGTGSLGFYFAKPYDNLYEDFIVEEGTDKVIYKKNSDAAKAAYTLAGKWYDKGLIYPDIMTANEADYRYQNMLNPVSYVLSFKEGVGSAERVAEIYSKDWGFDVVAIPVQNEYYIQNTWAAGGNGISSSCKHPEEAVNFIEALTTGTEKGKEIYNLIVFGIEGKHYTKDTNDTERIQTIEYSSSQGGVDTSYAGLKWIIGNTFNAYKNQAVLDDTYEIAKTLNESPDTKKSAYAGFTISTSKIDIQLSMVSAVSKEYNLSLLNGVEGADGWEARYDEFEKKVNTAGLNDVLAEFQSQIDQFNASK